MVRDFLKFLWTSNGRGLWKKDEEVKISSLAVQAGSLPPESQEPGPAQARR